MTHEEEKRSCPHCGAENPRSPLVTLCDECGRSLDGGAPPTTPAPATSAPAMPPKPCGPATPPLSIPQAPVPASMPEAPPEPAPAVGWRAALTLPVRVHVSVLFYGSMAGFAGVAILALTHSHWFDAVGIPFMPFGYALVPGLGGLAVAIVQLLLKFVILARCPECSGPAAFAGGRPITYRCRSCGHVHRTSVSWDE